MLIICLSRVEEHTKIFCAHRDDKTLTDYALVATQLVHAVLFSHSDKCKTSYQFPIQSHQQGVFDIFVKAMNGSALDTAVLALHELLLALFVPIPGHNQVMEPGGNMATKYSCTIECFLAVFMLREDGNFRSSDAGTNLCSKLKYLARIVTLYEANKTWTHVGGSLLRLVIVSARLTFTDTFISALQSIGSQTLNKQLQCPFASLCIYSYDWRNITKNTMQAPAVRVSADGMRITYKEKTLDIQKWRLGIQQCIQEVEESIKTLTFCQGIQINMPSTVVDDWTNATRGYSWMKTASYVSNPHSLLHIHLQQAEQTFIQLAHDGGLIINRTAAYQRLVACHSLLEKLAFLLYLTPGQQERATEFIDHKIANSTRPRTIFADDEYIWIVVRRVKYESQVRRETFLPQKLNAKISALLRFYLLIIRPFEHTLAYLLYEPSEIALYDEYLFVKAGRRWPDQYWRNLFPSMMEKYCGCHTGVHDYREINVQICRVFVGSESTFVDEQSDIFALQRGHSLSRMRQTYAPELGHLSSLTSDLLLRFSKASEVWWQVCALDTDKPGLLPIEQRTQGIASYPGLQQGGQTTDVNSLAKLMMPSIKEIILSQMQTVSVDLEKKLKPMLASILVSSHHALKESTGTPPIQPIQHVDRIDDVPETLQLSQDIVYAGSSISELAWQGLRLLFPNDPEVKWKSPEQQELVESVLRRDRNTIGVIPTAGGKSLAWNVPAKLPGTSLAVVIIANKALLKDQLGKSRKFGIPCARFRSSDNWVQLSSSTRILYLSLETAGTRRVSEYVPSPERLSCMLIIPSGRLLLNCENLTYVHLDECHLALLQCNFRDTFQRIVWLNGTHAQRVYTTGTMPPRLLDTFRLFLGIDKHARVIRAKTAQPLSRYSISYSEPHLTKLPRLIADAALYVTTQIWGQKSRQQGIIFCGSIAEVEAVAAAMKLVGLGKHRSHSGLTDTERSDDLWMNGMAQWIVSTTTMTEGVDNPRTGAVFFYEIVYGLINMVQGGGRGGRLGKFCYVATFTQAIRERYYPLKHPLSQREIDHVCQNEAIEWLQEADACRRVQVNDCMDGNRLTCGEMLPAELCDNCDPLDEFFRACLLMCKDLPQGSQYNMNQIAASLRTQPTSVDPMPDINMNTVDVDEEAALWAQVDFDEAFPNSHLEDVPSKNGLSFFFRSNVLSTLQSTIKKKLHIPEQPVPLI